MPHAFAALQELASGGLDTDQLLYRWVHVIAGVVWLGMMLGFVLVHQNAVAALEPAARKQAVLQYVPRTMFWFQWAALLTWLTGVALLMKLYYSSRSSPVIYSSLSEQAGTHMPWSSIGLAFLVLVVLFAVYDVVALAGAKLAEATYLVWAALALGYGCFLDSYLHMSHRAIFIHIGALLGTAMAANAWMRIAPAFKRIVAAAREGAAPAARDQDRAGTRSRHNLYMATPLLFLMVAVHQERLLGYERWQLPIGAVLLLGLGIGWTIRRAAASVGGG